MNTKQTQSPYMTRAEAADWWRKSVDTIDRWAVRLGWERQFDHGGGVLFLREQVTKSPKPVHRGRRFKQA